MKFSQFAYADDVVIILHRERYSAIIDRSITSNLKINEQKTKHMEIDVCIR